MTHRAFPPGRGNLKVPIDSRGSARAGLAMYAPCRPRGALARSVGWYVVGLFGPWALPGRPLNWEAPMAKEVWSELQAAWSEDIGPFDSYAVHERLQASRSGLALVLLRDGKSVGFVKARQGDPGPIVNEHRAIEAMHAHRPTTFSVPRPISTGQVEKWHYLLTSAFAPELHRVPSNPPLESITAEISEGLSSLIRSPAIPNHWRPMHGDFTPWNLRQRTDGSLSLVDWEEAGWAPPGSDMLLYETTVAHLRGTPVHDGADEARAFWITRLHKQQENSSRDRDAGLGQSLLELLER